MKKIILLLLLVPVINGCVVETEPTYMPCHTYDTIERYEYGYIAYYRVPCSHLCVTN
jgi:hypothetical protein